METFIVRVWVSPDSSEQEQLRGVVEHLGSGTETAFVDEDELLTLLRAEARTDAGGPNGGNAVRRREA